MTYSSLQKKFRQIIRHKSFLKYFKNTSWLIFERILRLTLGFIVSIWVVRYLGPDNFGKLSYAQSFVGLFAAFSTFGIDSILVRELVNDDNNKNQLLGTAICLKIIGSIIVVFLSLFSIGIFSNEMIYKNLILVLSISTFFQSFNVIDLYFQSKVQSKYIVIISSGSILIISLLKIILIIIKSSIIMFAIVITFESILIAIGLIYIYVKKNLKIKNWVFDLEIAKYFLKESWPLILSSMVISVYMKIDQIMIKEFLNNDNVGQYSAAVRLSEAWNFIPVLIASSLFPAVINSKKQGNLIYLNRLQKLYDMIVWGAILIAIPISIFSNKIIFYLYGDKFNLSADVLTIYIWATIFSFFGIIRGNWILVENLQLKGFYYLFLGTLTNIILNIMLIKILGINGAAISTLISLFAIIVIFPLFFKETRISVIMFLKTFNLIRILKWLKK